MVGDAGDSSIGDRQRLVREAIRKLTDSNRTEDADGSPVASRQTRKSGHKSMNADSVRNSGQDA
jgi:hypothetical protein